MEHNFWHSRWQTNEIHFHQADVNPQLQRYWQEIGAVPEGRVFVPLCGKSRDMLWLAEQGHRVLGVEISPIAARDFFRENQLAATITPGPDFQEYRDDTFTVLQGDFFALTPEHLTDVTAVYDRGSLVALPPDMRRRYAEHMAAILPSGTPILLVTMEYPQAEMEGPPFAVSEAELRSLLAGRFQVTLLGAQDILAESPRLQTRGLTRLHELAFRLVRR